MLDNKWQISLTSDETVWSLLRTYRDLNEDKSAVLKRFLQEQFLLYFRLVSWWDLNSCEVTLKGISESVRLLMEITALQGVFLNIAEKLLGSRIFLGSA